MPRTSSHRQILIEIAGLQSARARLIVFIVLSLAIYVSPYAWLEHLSLWQALGVPSPSIGLTRAYWLLLHFDFAGAWHRNALIYAVLAIGLPLSALDVWKILSHRSDYKKISA